MSFATAAKNSTTVARTANGMRTESTSGSAVLDLFGRIGSARGINLTSEFFAAMQENADLTMRMLLWVRDIRGGAGERGQFRALLAALDNKDPAKARKLMHQVPKLGRWDDLFAYTDYANRKAAFDFIKEALDNGNGLAAKWMPRKGPIAVELTRHFEMTPKQYRKFIVGLTTVVETKMCAKQWDEINFSHVPSMASARYQKAFGRNASEMYSKYIRELQKPVAERAAPVKINAGAIHPHDVVRSIARGNAAVADEQWKALPNYVGDARILPMVDVSASMGSLYRTYDTPQPIEVAVALGLYLSDKNTGPYKDLFLTFSENPEFVTVTGPLSNRVNTMSTANWNMNTDLHKAFDLILSVAQRAKVPADAMPEVLLILSDMQFDRCARYDDRAIEMIARKYSKAGYEVPKIVFWNLNAMYGGTPVTFDSRGVCHVSGFSPSLMKSVLGYDLEDYTPYNVMVKTLMDDRYTFE